MSGRTARTTRTWQFRLNASNKKVMTTIEMKELESVVASVVRRAVEEKLEMYEEQKRKFSHF